MLVSAGHDGLHPHTIRPFDEIYVLANRLSAEPEEQGIELWLPHNIIIEVHNTPYSPRIRVHRHGFLWHDRTREIVFSESSRWLSTLGFSTDDPRTLHNCRDPLLAVLPGSPMQDEFSALLGSQSWREIKDFHTRHRSWMQGRPQSEFALALAKRCERDKSLTAKLRRERGSACQICGFSFVKQDGTEYCEIHHLEWLSNGGYDTASNCLVLCANCHRRFHYGSTSILSHTQSSLVVLIDGVEHQCRVG